MSEKKVKGLAGFDGYPPHDNGAGESFNVMLSGDKGINPVYNIACTGADVDGSFLSYTDLFLKFQASTHQAELTIDHNGIVSSVRLLS